MGQQSRGDHVDIDCWRRVWQGAGIGTCAGGNVNASVGDRDGVVRRSDGAGRTISSSQRVHGRGIIRIPP